MENTLTRIKIFIDYKGITLKQFERDLGFSNASISNQYKNNGAIGSDKVEKILQSFPELNPVWLMKGEGEMLNTDGSSMTYEQTNKQTSTDNTSLEILAKAIDTLSESEKTNTKNIQELIAQGREQTSNITKLVDLLCRSGIATDVISDEEKRVQFLENDTDENTAYTAGAANVG